jgi:molybdopterin converting factor small subunit
VRVKVRTVGSLRSLLGAAELEFVLPAGSQVADLLVAIGETSGEDVARLLDSVDGRRVPPPLRVMVNGRDIGALDGPDTVLHDADDVLILTPLAGG